MERQIDRTEDQRNDDARNDARSLEHEARGQVTYDVRICKDVCTAACARAKDMQPQK